jgi:peptidase M28-like protein
MSADHMRSLVERLSALERETCSEGERRAAEIVADELRAAGAGDVRLEEERAHGTYWWPIGLPAGLAALAGLLGRRRLAFVTGLLAAASVADDVRFGARPLRRLLARKTTVNVVGEVGPADARRTLVFVSHHDAAHTGLVFSPAPAKFLSDRWPEAIDRTDTSPPLMWGAVFGPLLVAAGARRLGTILSAGYAAAMADIGTRSVVPGADDNATGCAVLVEVARAAAADPPPDTRVIFLSTGAEESFSEGMAAFGARHFASLPRATTTFVSVDTVGAPHLLALEGEGFFGISDYPTGLLDRVSAVADELGIELRRNLRTRTGTDGYVPLKAGYPTVSLASCDRFKQIPDYHLPTDTPDRVRWDTVDSARRLCEALLSRLG